MTFYQDPLNGDGCVGRCKPDNLHFAAKDQGKRARVAYARALFKLRRLQNLQMKHVSGSDGQAFGLRQAAARAAK